MHLFFFRELLFMLIVDYADAEHIDIAHKWNTLSSSIFHGGVKFTYLCAGYVTYVRYIHGIDGIEFFSANCPGKENSKSICNYHYIMSIVSKPIKMKYKCCNTFVIVIPFLQSISMDIQISISKIWANTCTTYGNAVFVVLSWIWFRKGILWF